MRTRTKARQQIRKVHKFITKLSDVSYCTKCVNDFTASCHTYVGFDGEGVVHLTGDCCKGLLSGGIYSGGVFSKPGDSPGHINQLVNSHPLSSMFATNYAKE